MKREEREKLEEKNTEKWKKLNNTKKTGRNRKKQKETGRNSKKQ